MFRKINLVAALVIVSLSAKAQDKIDGIVGLCMAIGVAIAEPVQPVSVYETRGVLIF